MYIKETAETILPSDIDTDGMLLLLEAAAKQMREDYITGHGKYEADKKNVKKRMSVLEAWVERAPIRKKNRDAIEKWLTEGQGGLLLQISDPKPIIQELRKLANQYERERLDCLRGL